MSREVVFYGASDDLFEIRGSVGDEPDEIGCFHVPVEVTITSVTEGELSVVGIYSPTKSGCWCIGIMPVDEDIPIPSWPVSIALNEIRPGQGYSTELAIIIPDDAKLEHKEG